MSTSQPEQSHTAQLAVLGAASYAALQTQLRQPTIPEISSPDLDRLWRGVLSASNALHLDAVRARLYELDRELADFHWARETELHATFLARSRARLEADAELPLTRERLNEILARERYWAGLHYLASARRARRIVEHVSLRQNDVRTDSQGGARWWMNLSRATHTPDCRLLHGRVWSWRVLRFINPANRHAGCGCHLQASADRPIDEFPQGVELGFDMGEIRPRYTFQYGGVDAAELLAGMR